jgi:hypothetical protein
MLLSQRNTRFCYDRTRPPCKKLCRICFLGNKLMTMSFKRSLLLLFKTQLTVFFLSGFVYSIIGLLDDSSVLSSIEGIGVSWASAGTACVVSTVYFYTVGLLFHRIFVTHNITGLLQTSILAVFLGLFVIITLYFVGLLSNLGAIGNSDLAEAFYLSGAILGYTFTSCLVIRYFTLKELRR